MPAFEIHVIINKPVGTVYQAYINPNNMLHWTKYLEEFKVIRGKPLEIGSIAQLYFNRNGRKYILEDKLEFVEPERKLVTQLTGEGLKVKVQTIFFPLQKNTRLTLLWNGKGNRIITQCVISILRNRIKRQALAELKEFKELVEKFGATFY